MKKHKVNFTTHNLIVDDLDITLDDINKIVKQGTGLESIRDHQYEISKEFINNRFLWIHSEYNDTNKYNNTVINAKNNTKEANPRRPEQKELNKDLFICYDYATKMLYISNKDKLNVVKKYFSNTLQKEIIIKNIFKSLEEFEKSIKTLTKITFVSPYNLQNLSDDSVFNKTANIYGLGSPEQMKIDAEYNIPVLGNMLNQFKKFKNSYDIGEIKECTIIGKNDKAIEEIFDFAKYQKRYSIETYKDENYIIDEDTLKNNFFKEICKEDRIE